MTTSIKIKFRPSAVAGKAGTVYYQLIHNRQVARINTDIHLHPAEWHLLCDPQQVLSGLLLLIRQRIDYNIEKVREIIRNCDKNGGTYSVKTVVLLYQQAEEEHLFIKRTYADVSSASGKSFFAFMQSRICELKETGRNSTAENYIHTRNSLIAFVAGRDISVQMITETFIERYEAWLKVRGLKRNSISFYMRILRAVYNRAVRLRLVRQTYPFGKVYTGTDRTPKRAVREETIKALKELDVITSKGLQLAKDLFMFSFAACGMPFVDMVYLRKSNIRDGYICYERKKTGQPLQIKVVAFLENIIKKYADTESPYVFPVLTSTDSTIAYREYRNALMVYNHRLRKLSSMLPQTVGLTSYVSRHSWATIARNHGTPASVIGKALGHTNESTTQIYLASIDESVADKMNEELLLCLQRNSVL